MVISDVQILEFPEVSVTVAVTCVNPTSLQSKESISMTVLAIPQLSELDVTISAG